MRYSILFLLLSGCSTGGLKYVSAPDCQWGSGNPHPDKIEVCSKVQLYNRTWIEDCHCQDYERFRSYEKKEWAIKVQEFKKGSSTNE